MKASFAAAAVAAATVVSAARPNGTSICDYYTTALLKNNTAANQATLLTLVVNTAVIGNYTTPNVGIAVPGILTKGTYGGEDVNLLPYFSGALDSTNNGGSAGVSVNFLDGGGATPLEKNMAANTTTSAQYTLLTHLYEYFAYLLSCSEYGNTTSPYAGHTSMYEVHKYMGLSEAEVGYFITQVGLSAASFGVASSDVAIVGAALNSTFGLRCSPAVSVPASAPAAPQAICIASDCPLSPNSTCSLYAPVVEPSAAPTSSASATAMAPNATSSVMPYTGAGLSLAPVTSVAALAALFFAVLLM